MQLQDMLFNLQVRDTLDAHWLTVDDVDQERLDCEVTQQRLAGYQADEAALNIAIAHDAA